MSDSLTTLTPESVEDVRDALGRIGFWFVDVPRTSSTAIKRQLVAKHGAVFGKRGDRQGVEEGLVPDHTPAAVLREALGSDFWARLKQFAVVRNPWDRALSMYLFRRDIQGHHLPAFERYLEMMFDHRQALAAGEDPTEVAGDLFAYHGYWWSCSRFLCAEDGDLLVTDVIRYERRDEDLAALAERWARPGLAAPSPRLSSTRHDHYAWHYSDLARDLVAEIYADDIERFGYEYSDRVERLIGEGVSQTFEPTPRPPAPAWRARQRVRQVASPGHVYTSIGLSRLAEQQLAVQSWLNFGLEVTSLNSEREIRGLKAAFPQVRFVPTRRHGQSLYGRPLTYLADIFQQAILDGREWFCLFNADVSLRLDAGYLWPDLLRFAPRTLLFGSRAESRGMTLVDDNQYLGGFDYFFIPVQACHEFPRTQLALGAPWWDYFWPLAALRYGVPCRRINVALGIHNSHDVQWSESMLTRALGEMQVLLHDDENWPDDDGDLTVDASNRIYRVWRDRILNDVEVVFPNAESYRDAVTKRYGVPNEY